MIGFFTGNRLPYHAVNLIAKKVWGPHGLEQVLTMADGFFIFHFKLEEVVTEVIERGPWMIGGKHIILQKWTPDFQFDRSKVTKLSVWIRLRGLPLSLWTKQGLSLAASMAGKPLSCDEQTINCRHLEFARLCVELNVGLPFVHHFDIDSPLKDEPLRVNVEYEWKPTRCDGCKSFGHNCSARMKGEDKTIEVHQDKENHQQPKGKIPTINLGGTGNPKGSSAVEGDSHVEQEVSSSEHATSDESHREDRGKKPMIMAPQAGTQRQDDRNPNTTQKKTQSNEGEGATSTST
ncbi:hypothetical protein OIU78_027975 [Salix suchowensis]|nr:hypothetical protein OIU78_027975 [Salix suchowensis]